ncbi:polyisoprenyl-teichoic acid--peptidoglycan teichoic acid transferase TagU [Bacillus sp. B-jedd]|uniref:polyisoprenyl-teichoic acid--peptidoglycan teichoic acid transferase TagU n=1 Tax=Bacillus sp. B-jedd TaxID=1476857 RepID=UPI00051568EA|nr:LytR family transcriptional regulator [Bacillus sp. B-jedd]CEG29118.1 membrane-bound protein transcriptional regulator LytR [Bacillus sp. B-jedd]
MRHKKKKNWMKVLFISLLIMFLAVGTYAFTVYRSLTNAVEKMHKPIDRDKSPKRAEEITFGKKEPFSVLLLGVDERDGDRGRSDSMIVLTANPHQESIKMLSIPRDTRTEIVGKGKDDKINHAYAFGGVEMSMDTVEHFLDIPIDYYVKINMEGFKDIVNAVGGVKVNNSFAFSSDGESFPKGEINLNGESALKYARMRYEDPRGDFGRQNRQRDIIQAVISRGASFQSLSNFGEIFGALGKNVRTNLSFDQMVGIQRNYKPAGKNVQQLELKGSGTKIDKIYYFIVPQEVQQDIQDELKAHLEIK